MQNGGEIIIVSDFLRILILEQGDDKMKRFTEVFAGDTVTEVSNEINEYAEKYNYNIIQVSLVVTKYIKYRCIVIFEEE